MKRFAAARRTKRTSTDESLLYDQAPGLSVPNSRINAKGETRAAETPGDYCEILVRRY